MSGNYVFYDIATLQEIWKIKDAERVFFSGTPSEVKDEDEDAVSYIAFDSQLPC